MQSLTQIELQHIRQIIEMNQNEYQKMKFYLSQAKDIQIQQIITQIQQESLNTKQILIGFLNN